MTPLLAPFPSKTIALYAARMFIVRTLAFALGLAIVLQTLDLLTESGKILAVAGNDESSLWLYVGLRFPQILSFALPFSVLLGTLVTFLTLNQNSEVTIFKAAGLSAHQILMPLTAAAFGITLFTFAFNELLLVRTNARLAAWQAADYGATPTDGSVTRAVWVREGSDLILAQRVDGFDEDVVLNNVTIYDRTGNRLTGIIRAVKARPAPGGWRLSGVRGFDMETAKVTTAPSLFLALPVAPERFTGAVVKADQMPFWELVGAIENLKAAGRPTAQLEGALHHKLSGPLSAILMPLLGSVAAFGLARSGKLFVRVVAGMALGFGFFVADNFMLAMGNFGAVPPVLAAWSPILLFALIGEALLFRTEE